MDNTVSLFGVLIHLCLGQAMQKQVRHRLLWLPCSIRYRVLMIFDSWFLGYVNIVHFCFLPKGHTHNGSRVLETFLMYCRCRCVLRDAQQAHQRKGKPLNLGISRAHSERTYHLLSPLIIPYYLISPLIISYHLLYITSYHFLLLFITSYFLVSPLLTPYHLLSPLITSYHLL